MFAAVALLSSLGVSSYKVQGSAVKSLGLLVSKSTLNGLGLGKFRVTSGFSESWAGSFALGCLGFEGTSGRD